MTIINYHNLSIELSNRVSYGMRYFIRRDPVLEFCAKKMNISDIWQPSNRTIAFIPTGNIVCSSHLRDILKSSLNLI
jgi:hypothetical protein